MRVAFFNELDTYAEVKGLSTKHLLDGVGADPRIGNHYNNPSFGYGGYCLPKDTMQLSADYKSVPNNLIRAIVDSNKTRKDHIADRIMARNPKVVGIYRLAMKKGADNCRSSSVYDVIASIREKGIEVIIYEPLIDIMADKSLKVTKDLRYFKECCDLIIANRMSEEIQDVKDKVYSRDIYDRD